MNQKPINKRSAKGKRLDVADKLMSQIMRIKYGPNCQICGRPGRGVFHIANKKDYPRIRYHEWNLLWTDWMHCHHPWHHYGPKHPVTRRIEDKIKELRTKTYWQDLMIINMTAPKMTTFQLELVIVALRQELKANLRGKK